MWRSIQGNNVFNNSTHDKENRSTDNVQDLNDIMKFRRNLSVLVKLIQLQSESHKHGTFFLEQCLPLLKAIDEFVNGLPPLSQDQCDLRDNQAEEMFSILQSKYHEVIQRDVRNDETGLILQHAIPSLVDETISLHKVVHKVKDEELHSTLSSPELYSESPPLGQRTAAPGMVETPESSVMPLDDGGDYRIASEATNSSVNSITSSNLSQSSVIAAANVPTLDSLSSDERALIHEAMPALPEEDGDLYFISSVNTSTPDTVATSFGDGNSESPSLLGDYEIAQQVFVDEIANEINELVEAFSDSQHPIATELNLAGLVVIKLSQLLVPELDPDAIQSLLGDLITALSGKNRCREHIIALQKGKTRILEVIPSLSGNQTRGEMIILLDGKMDVDIEKILSDTEKNSTVLNAIHQYVGKQPSSALVRQFCIFQNSERNMLMIMVKASIGVDVLEGFSVRELALDDSNFELACRLYEATMGRELDVDVVSALELIVKIILPHLRSDACEEDKNVAMKLLLNIKDQVLQTKGGRAEMIKGKFRAAAGKSIMGQTIAARGTDYFDYRNHRSDAIHVLICLLLAPEIEAKLPKIFSAERGGFLPLVLRMSWSDLKTLCNKFGKATFLVEDKVSHMKEKTETLVLKHNTVSSNEKKTKIVFFSQEQVNSLLELAGL